MSKVSKKTVLGLSAAIMFAAQGEAAAFSSCTGVVTKVNDIMTAYGTNSGGQMQITVNNGCAGQTFWYDDDAVRSKNVMAVGLTAMSTGLEVKVFYDPNLALSGTAGKLLSIGVSK